MDAGLNVFKVKTVLFGQFGAVDLIQPADDLRKSSISSKVTI